MASRKNLKKNVNYIIETIAGLCIVSSLENQGEKSEKASRLFLQAMNLRNDIISRISHTEPGAVKAFDKKLKQEFTEKVNALSERIIQA